MRVAVVLSGTVRNHEKSLRSLEVLRRHHDVNVYGHAWACADPADSWSKYPVEDPSHAVLEEYSFNDVRICDWPDMRCEFVEKVVYWQKHFGMKNFTHYGMLGMWYSLSEAFHLVPLNEHDAYVRLRYDCAFDEDPLRHDAPGWHVPDAVDFGGLCDQLAWYVGNNRQNLETYFHTYHWISRWIESGVPYSPECLLAKSFSSLVDHAPHRPKFKYTLHDD